MNSERLAPTPSSAGEWKHLWSWMILLGIGMTWGSSYFFIKKALIAFNPYQIGSLRLVLAAIFFLPFAIRRLHLIQPHHWIPLIVVGVCGSAVPAFLFPFAQTQLSSSFTGVLSSTTPIFTLALGALFFKLVLTKRKIVGVAVGFVGAVFLILLSGQGKLEGDPRYALLALTATLFYATSSNTINTYLNELGTISISSIAYVLLGIPAVFLLGFTGISEVYRTHPEAFWTSFGYVAILSLAGTALASIFFFKLIKMSGVVFASSISYIIPCFAVLIGFLDGEALTWVHAAGMILILAGIYLTGKR